MRRLLCARRLHRRDRASRGRRGGHERRRWLRLGEERDAQHPIQSHARGLKERGEEPRGPPANRTIEPDRHDGPQSLPRRSKYAADSRDGAGAVDRVPHADGFEPALVEPDLGDHARHEGHHAEDSDGQPCRGQRVRVCLSGASKGTLSLALSCTWGGCMATPCAATHLDSRES